MPSWSFLVPPFAPRSSLSFRGNIPFLLDLHRYLENLTFIFRFREIYLPLQVKIHCHSIVGLNFVWNRKWAFSRVLGLFGPFFDLDVFTTSSKERFLTRRRFNEEVHFSYSLDNCGVKLTIAVYTISMDFIRENSLCDSYCKAPMLTPIDTKRGIDLSRFGERHKVRSASSYSESGGVGRRIGRCVQSNSPNGRVGWCAQSNSPVRRVGLLVWFRDPFLSCLLLRNFCRECVEKGFVRKWNF